MRVSPSLPVKPVFQRRNQWWSVPCRERIFSIAVAWWIYQNTKAKNPSPIIVRVLYRSPNRYAVTWKTLTSKKACNVRTDVPCIVIIINFDLKWNDNVGTISLILCVKSEAITRTIQSFRTLVPLLGAARFVQGSSCNDDGHVSVERSRFPSDWYQQRVRHGRFVRSFRVSGGCRSPGRTFFNSRHAIPRDYAINVCHLTTLSFPFFSPSRELRVIRRRFYYP